MDLRFSAADEAFRQEVRAFLEANLDDKMRHATRHVTSIFHDPVLSRRWHKRLAAQGWAAPNWPKEHGGTGWTPVQRFIFESECGLAAAPNLSPMGINMVAYVIMRYGTQAQKDRFLPRILNADDLWCQGYSEPGSGSDLASLKTRAVRDGDHYVLNGTKIWTTQAHAADWMFLLARTSDEDKPQKGISFLLTPMTAPGITVRPILSMSGDHELNQVFFDDVRVPVDLRVGEEGKGWTYAKVLLEYERGGRSGTPRMRAQQRRIRGLIQALAALGVDPLQDPGLAGRLTDLDIRIDALEITELRLMSAMSAGESPGDLAPMLKVIRSSLVQDMTVMAMEVAGLMALMDQDARMLEGANVPVFGPSPVGAVTPTYLNTRASTIKGGTSEVQRDIMARMLLAV